MLQQTTVPHVLPYFQSFTTTWPSVEALAAAEWETVSAAWAGLGYYSRARNLHACARLVAASGGFPQDAAGLLVLPGVGPYTAAAIAAIAFGARELPVDGNIERVLSRLFAIGSDRTPAGWRAAKQQITATANRLAEMAPPDIRCGDLAQGLMDLGATLCTPASPNCPACPLSAFCLARASGHAQRYPEKPLKTERPLRRGAAFVATRQGRVWLVRRPPAGLLGGMLMPPTSDWLEGGPAPSVETAPFPAGWCEAGEVRHVFTHFALRLTVWRGDLRLKKDEPANADGVWMPIEEALQALPTIGRKAVALAAASHA
jgi:A/G-specific adenine glycosylase